MSKDKLKLIRKLQDIHNEYLISDHARKMRLINASGFVVQKLSLLGVEESWSETYICYGDEFLIHEYGIGLDLMLDSISGL